MELLANKSSVFKYKADFDAASPETAAAALLFPSLLEINAPLKKKRRPR
jgi:hypothetical protein